MNPNSAHQNWSEWVFVVEAAGPQPRLEAVTLPMGRFFTSVFGSTGRVKIEQAVNAVRRRTTWTITAQVEGESLYQAGWRARVKASFIGAAKRRFGACALTSMDVRLLAGQTEDARPSTQWLILPAIEIPAHLLPDMPPPAQTVGAPALASGARAW